ncbi:MAG: hypothetical protein KDH09_00785 [Chrysiogenetes bacterium]|nr:hypothetical protein [Chrysiogenetes bacterium]
MGNTGRKPGLIEVRLDRIDQLFNSLDPSPFREKDLRREAEEFIVSWAEEFPRDCALSIVLHLREAPPSPLDEKRIAQAVQNYFDYQASGARRELSHLLRQGRTSLIVGVSFLTLCLFLADFLAGVWTGQGSQLAVESLTIGGWVAMWRPLETYLYGWWPIRRKKALYARLSQAEVTLKIQ